MEVSCDSAEFDNRKHDESAEEEADGAFLSIAIEGTAHKLQGNMVVYYEISAHTQVGPCARTGPCERNYREFEALHTALSRKSKLRIPKVRALGGVRELENPIVSGSACRT
jgi:hypothetical protein